MTPLLSGSLVAIALLTSSACRSVRDLPEGSPLPFHVALIPTEVHDISVLTAARSEPLYAERSQHADDGDMRLEISTAAMSEALRGELARAFVRTTLLDLPEEPGAVAAMSPMEREQYWQEEARAAGADLLVRTRLLVDPAVTGERNEKFWLNLPLFLLGGPMCYFVGDRRYELTARLQAEVFDASEGHERLEDYALLTIPLYVESRDVDLRFLDRADGAEDYLFSLLVPSGLLARKTAAIEEELEERLPADLGRDLADKVLAERAQLEQNLALGAFKLESEVARLEPADGGKVHVRVPVQELSGRGVLHRYELRAGDILLASRDFRADAGDDGPRMIDDELAVPEGAEYLNVRLTDAQANTRSYTLRIRPPRR